MNGTEWTEPGQGVTLGEIYSKLVRRQREIPVSELLYDLCSGVFSDVTNTPGTRNWTDRTNLRLTGAPLTAEDLQRIAEAK